MLSDHLEKNETPDADLGSIAHTVFVPLRTLANKPADPMTANNHDLKRLLDPSWGLPAPSPFTPLPYSIPDLRQLLFNVPETGVTLTKEKFDEVWPLISNCWNQYNKYTTKNGHVVVYKCALAYRRQTGARKAGQEEDPNKKRRVTKPRMPRDSCFAMIKIRFTPELVQIEKVPSTSFAVPVGHDHPIALSDAASRCRAPGVSDHEQFSATAVARLLELHERMITRTSFLLKDPKNAPLVEKCIEWTEELTHKLESM